VEENNRPAEHDDEGPWRHVRGGESNARPGIELQRDLGREELRARRDARYRTNIAFAVRQLRALILLAVFVGWLVFGLPIPHRVAHPSALHTGWPTP
jgi:hypothetical protein